MPELGAPPLTRRDTICPQEQRIETVSSRQPEGLMTRLMGETMMRKDGAAHARERKACFPAYSPRSIGARASRRRRRRANIRLAISGDRNEPRDAMAGCAWALPTHRAQLALVRKGRATWKQAFEVYVRWTAPIGMSPREVARQDAVDGVPFDRGDWVFLMFGIGNRAPAVFDRPEGFDITRDTGPSLAFGARPHFCAGAAASRCPIAEVALPRIFARFANLRLAGRVVFDGRTFRGPRAVPVRPGVA